MDLGKPIKEIEAPAPVEAPVETPSEEPVREAEPEKVSA